MYAESFNLHKNIACYIYLKCTHVFIVVFVFNCSFYFRFNTEVQ
jgi:hypothetical protein